MDHAACVLPRGPSRSPGGNVGEALQQVSPCDLGFHARESGAQTVVHAESKGQMSPGIVAVDVEGVRVDEDSWVSVGSGQHEHDGAPALQS